MYLPLVKESAYCHVTCHTICHTIHESHFVFLGWRNLTDHPTCCHCWLLLETASPKKRDPLLLTRCLFLFGEGVLAPTESKRTAAFSRRRCELCALKGPMPTLICEQQGRDASNVDPDVLNLCVLILGVCLVVEGIHHFRRGEPPY